MSKPASDAANTSGPKPAGAFLNRTKPTTTNPADPNQPPAVPLTETEQVQLQCDNAVLEVHFFKIIKIIIINVFLI